MFHYLVTLTNGNTFIYHCALSLFNLINDNNLYSALEMNNATPDQIATIQRVKG